MTPLHSRRRAASDSAGARVPSPRGRGAAHGKTILLGEHSVVYGAPAIALPVTSLEASAQVTTGHAAPAILDSTLYRGTIADAPHRLGPVRAAWDAATEHFGVDPTGKLLRLSSTIPHERGLGSSAAVAAAVVQAVATSASALLPADIRHELIQVAERVAHGTPSGLDARTVVAEGAVRFERGHATPLALADDLAIVIADSGVRGATSTAVGEVRARREREPQIVDRIIDELADIVEAAETDLHRGDHEALGGRMHLAHELLSTLGVGHPALDRLVLAAEAAGALGAKLTGSGHGGCVIALAPSLDAANDLEDALARAGAAGVWTTVIRAAEIGRAA